MPPQLRPQVIDSLWHCLCPSFNHNAWHLSASHLRAVPWKLQKQRTRKPFTSDSHRDGTAATAAILLQPAISGITNSKHTDQNSDRAAKESLTLRDKDTGLLLDYHATIKAQSRQRGQAGVSLPDHVKKLPTLQLYAVLQEEADLGRLSLVNKIVQILVRDRGEKPDRRHYDALILAQSDAQHGSAAEVERLLQEMQRVGIELDARMCSAVLKVLAVHPHYMLRCHVIREMKKSWYTVEKDDHQNIAVGLLRDLQFELAWDRLDDMQTQGYTPDPWLLNLFIYTLGSVQCIPEAHSMLKSLLTSPEYRLPADLWSYLLHTATREQYQPMVEDVWNHAVKSGFINPSSGLCTMVLECCAVHGNTVLAAEVFRLLSQRSSPLESWHYESFVEAYIVSGDLEGMLSSIQIMTEAGFPLTLENSRSIFTCLHQSEDLVIDCLGYMARAVSKKKSVPIALVNAALEALCNQGKLLTAIDILHDLKTVTEEPANRDTFNALLQGCTIEVRKDLAMSLAYEMQKSGIAPNALTYDRLLLVCLSTGSRRDFEDAWRYYDEMRASAPTDASGKKQHWNIRRGTARRLAVQCVVHSDSRFRILLQNCADDGMDVSGIVKTMRNALRERHASKV